MLKSSHNIFIQVSFLSIIVLITSCKPNKSIIETLEPYPVIVLEQNEIDVNNDNEPDFIFETKYIGINDEPMSDMSIILEIQSYDNLLLYKIDDGFIPFSNGEMIQENMGTMFVWDNYGADIVGINWQINEGWDAEWFGTWVDVSNKYIPFALTNLDSIYYGWIEMSINTNMDTCFVEVHGYNYNKNAGQSINAGE